MTTTETPVSGTATQTQTQTLPGYFYGSFGRRLIATILDALILIVPFWAVNHILPVLGGLLVAVLYAPILESSEIQATIGKHLMGIQVTDVAGRRISFRAALIRCFVKFVSSMLLFLGHLIALFTERKQALHDIVADTVVVYGRSEKPIVDAWVEELKAIFGGHAQSITRSSSLARLERLQALREKGALSDEEFLREKQKILDEG